MAGLYEEKKKKFNEQITLPRSKVSQSESKLLTTTKTNQNPYSTPNKLNTDRYDPSTVDLLSKEK